jgi:N-acetylmuramoyl-L-alanine amidase
MLFEREDWGYRTAGPLVWQGWDAHEVFVHHTDDSAAGINSFEEQKARMRGYQNYHIDTNGWNAIGYHYVVFPEFGSVYARIFEGRPRSAVPAAQQGHNTGTLAVCVVGAGNFRMDDSQRYAVEQLIEWLQASGAPLRTLGGHRDVTPTSCPGDGIYQYDLRLIRDATNLRRYGS